MKIDNWNISVRNYSFFKQGKFVSLLKTIVMFRSPQGEREYCCILSDLPYFSIVHFSFVIASIVWLSQEKVTFELIFSESPFSEKNAVVIFGEFQNPE